MMNRLAFLWFLFAMFTWPGFAMSNSIDTEIINSVCYDNLIQQEIAQIFDKFHKNSAISNGKVTVTEANVLRADFQSKSGKDVYIISYSKQPSARLQTGLKFNFRISGWKQIKYLAYGWVDPQGKYWHIKITKPRMNTWISEDIIPGSVMFSISNNWQIPESGQKIAYVKIFIKGKPMPEGGVVELQAVESITSQLVKNDFLLSVDGRFCKFSDSGRGRWWRNADFHKVSPEIVDVLDKYIRTLWPTYKQDADYFIQTGGVSLSGMPTMAWSTRSQLPKSLNEYTTMRYLWHALNPVSVMIQAYKDTNKISYLYTARDFTSKWIDRNFYQKPADVKYAWYDHGTSTRLMAFLMLWDVGMQEGFDNRFMSRLLDAIYHHGQLLVKEAFYARNQIMRHHNHAVFQDVALLLVHEFVPHITESKKWQKIAFERLSEQFDSLITLENGSYAVNKENSSGYHAGMAIICHSVDSLIRASRITNYSFTSYCKGLDRFMKEMRYPDGRSPSYGDSFRLPNSRKFIDKIKGIDIQKPLLCSFKKSGYVILKDKVINKDVLYQLVFIAPSQTIIHKHKDNLSFSFWADGIEWLIDPGFYSHHYNEPKPAYARGQLAHNALVVPDSEYHIEPGLTTISGCASAEEFGKAFEIAGSHRAYSGMTVHRKISGRFGNGELFIRDEVIGEKPEVGLLMLHLGETVLADLQQGKLILSSHLSDLRLLICLPVNAHCDIKKGVDDGITVSGWSFPSFAKGIPINTISCEISLNAPVDWSIKILPTRYRERK